jgi:uncharacterized membrane protein
VSERTGAAATPGNREIYIDVFRGLMALVMVQGHVSDTLLSPALQADPLYQSQRTFHGSTAPGFLFASGFVAGLPRSPLSAKASLRRARRLLFVLGVGYFLHLPYFSFWKTLQASAAEKAALYACDALQCIAVTQLLVLALQWLAGVRWTAVAGVLAAVVLAAGPFVWSARLAERLAPALGAYLDESTGSHFPLFPFAAFVLAGTVAGTTLGRREPSARHRRTVQAGLALIAAGVLVHLPLAGRVDFWHISPAYVLVRLGGLLLLLRLVEAASRRGWPGIGTLALFGHETLQVFVLHLVLLFGGVIGPSALLAWHGRLGYAATAGVLLAMLPVLYASAWLWHRAKVAAPHETRQALGFLSALFLWEFFTRPW